MSSYLKKAFLMICRFCISLYSWICDRFFLKKEIPLAVVASHRNWAGYLSGKGNRKGVRILEIGSRVVTGANLRNQFSDAEYVGFDIYPGDNVDVVGDAHKLSRYFKQDEKFDIIFSSAVFEHLAMPWLVAVEIAKLLKVGGIVFVETHFSFATHQRPWNFFQYSDMGLKALFNSALGFRCIEAGFSNPMVGRFSSLADDYLRNSLIARGLYCHSEYLGEKVAEVEGFSWEMADLNEVVGGTVYPVFTPPPN